MRHCGRAAPASGWRGTDTCHPGPSLTVRGVFDGLSTDQRAELLARAAEHDVLRAAFTPEGHLSYDLAARSAFTFRFLDSGEEEEHILAPAVERSSPLRAGVP